ncbi:MAG: hypothetical protein IPH82_26785 [Chloroflexi bacterium]|nr:hypothetical protein [Chloroflexota bacterium]
MRQSFMDNYTLASLIRPEFHAFLILLCDDLRLYTSQLRSHNQRKGAFIDWRSFTGLTQRVKALEAIQNPDCGYACTTPPPTKKIRLPPSLTGSANNVKSSDKNKPG